ncbi:MAG: HD domain-containing protein [Clostridia bacterium]|nr:HD domain-containing protein [Clostridia bacterium]
MIDMKKATMAFSEYVKPYDISNPKIELKVKHTFRTVEVAKKIAEDLNLNEEQILLAQIIGLLHDIGRFEQLRIYDTFRDKDSIDHANFAVKILFEDGLIRNFIQDTKYDDIIYKAIKNHNKFKIEEGLNEEELLQARIIRDADKTDIFAVFVEDIEQNKNVLYDYEEISKQELTPKIMEDFKAYRQSNRDNYIRPIDNYINIIAFIFDYNFLTGLKIIKQNKYIERTMQPICICDETKEQMQKIIKIANTYIEERIKKGC